MAIPFELEGNSGRGKKLRAAVVSKQNINGVVAYTRDFDEFDVLFQPALNETFGVEMAQDFSFSGVPVGVHDGIDSVLWTGSAITGTKFTFNSTDEFNSGTKSVKTNKAGLNDVMEFDKGSDLDLSVYVAITLFIHVNSGWTVGNSVSIVGFDTGTSMPVGNSVALEDFFNETEFNVWHKITIPLADMGLEASTIDALRIQITAKSGGGPVFYIDDMQVEQSGNATTFKVEAPQGKLYFVQSISFSFVDAINTTLASNSMFNLSYDKILGLTQLENGIVFQRVSAGVILFSASIKTIGDSIKGGGTLKNVISDGTNTCITLETDFGEPAVLDSRLGDSIDIILSDDLSGLVSFTSIFKGKTRDI